MRKLLLCSFVILSFLSPIHNMPDEGVILNSDVFGPYKRFNDDTNINFSYEYFGYNYATISESISYINPVTSRVHYKRDYESHIMSKGETYGFSFPMLLRTNFNDDGAIIRITIRSDNGVIFLEEGYIKPYKKYSTEQVISLTNYNFKTEGFSFYFKDSELITIDDDIVFDLDKMNLDHDFYYKLDLSKLSFICNNKKLFYEDAYLTFNDYNHIFKYLEHDQNNLIKIPLELYLWNKKVSISLKGPFYVNPISFEMVTYPKDGFIYSNYFFLPKNAKGNIDDTNFTIHIRGLGYSEYNLKYVLSYSCDASLIGTCMSSDYCVIGDYF